MLSKAGSHSQQVQSPTAHCTLQFRFRVLQHCILYYPCLGVTYSSFRVLQHTVLSHSGSDFYSIVYWTIPFWESLTFTHSSFRVLQHTVPSNSGSDFYSIVYCTIPLWESLPAVSESYSILYSPIQVQTSTALYTVLSHFGSHSKQVPSCTVYCTLQIRLRLLQHCTLYSLTLGVTHSKF